MTAADLRMLAFEWCASRAALPWAGTDHESLAMARRIEHRAAALRGALAAVGLDATWFETLATLLGEVTTDGAYAARPWTVEAIDRAVSEWLTACAPAPKTLARITLVTKSKEKVIMASEITVAREILRAAADDATCACELAQVEVTAGRAGECQDWDHERSWFRFGDGSVLCVEGASADERSDAEYCAVVEHYATLETAKTIAEHAIERSISHNEIVTIDYDASASLDLSCGCEDSVEANGLTEYWGATDDGREWRVHMRDRD